MRSSATTLNGLASRTSFLRSQRNQLSTRDLRKKRIKPDAVRLESLEHADPWLVEDVARLATEMEIPLIIETGMKTSSSVEQAITAARKAGCTQLLLEDGIMTGPIDELSPEHVAQLAKNHDVPVGSFDRTDLARNDPRTADERAFSALSAGEHGAISYNVQIRLSNSQDRDRDASVLPGNFGKLSTRFKRWRVRATRTSMLDMWRNVHSTKLHPPNIRSSVICGAPATKVRHRDNDHVWWAEPAPPTTLH